MSVDKNLALFQRYLDEGLPTLEGARFTFPSPIAKTLGMHLKTIGEACATFEMTTKVDQQANPMGTVHGGVLCDFADYAIGTAHSTTLLEGESFTSIDLQINFFRPLWDETIKAVVKPVHRGRTVSRYVCDIFKADGKLAAQVTSTVTTLRGDQSKGR